MVSITPSKAAAMALVTKSTTLPQKACPQMVAVNVIHVPITPEWTLFTTAWTSQTMSKLSLDITPNELF